MVYKVEEKWIDRPAWIRISHKTKKAPRFLSVRVPKHGELIYKAFGHYYYPVGYTNDEERRFMNGMAAEYDEMVADVFNIPMAKALLSRLPLKKINKSVHILDLGCGTGIMTELLAREGFSRFTLVDFSKGMLAEAKNKLGRSRMINYEKIDVTKGLPKGIFNAVVSVMLFNTFNDRMTNLILGRLVQKMSKNALFGVVEDSKKPAYAKYFRPVVSEMVNVGLRTKYIFVGTRF